MLELARSWAGDGEAQILGTPFRTDCVRAAFFNAYVADVLDFDDTLVSHPGAVAVPAALAVGERVGASGEDLLTALVASYEIGIRVGYSVMPTSTREATEGGAEFGWKAYLSVVAAGRLLGLDIPAWIEALGYAGAASPVGAAISVHDRPLSSMKANFSGQAEVGVMSALLAQHGFVARRPALEASGQFARWLGSDRWRPGELTRGLGETWVTEAVTLKPYPCCRFIHAVLDALHDVLREMPVTPDDVREVRVFSFADFVEGFADRRPSGMTDAQFSAPYAVAMTLLDVPRTATWSDESRLADPQVHSLMDRVRLAESPEFTATFAAERRAGGAVEVELVDGRVLRASRDRPRGGPEAPMPEEELERKFFGLVEPVLGVGRAREAYDTLLALDELGNVQELAVLLAADY